MKYRIHAHTPRDNNLFLFEIEQHRAEVTISELRKINPTWDFSAWCALPDEHAHGRIKLRHVKTSQTETAKRGRPRGSSLECSDCEGDVDRPDIPGPGALEAQSEVSTETFRGQPDQPDEGSIGAGSEEKQTNNVTHESEQHTNPAASANV